MKVWTTYIGDLSNGENFVQQLNRNARLVKYSIILKSTKQKKSEFLIPAEIA